MKREGYRAGVEYIAMNDEPLILYEDAMIGMPSVQLLGVLFGKSGEQVARDVIKFRTRIMNMNIQARAAEQVVKDFPNARFMVHDEVYLEPEPEDEQERRLRG